LGKNNMTNEKKKSGCLGTLVKISGILIGLSILSAIIIPSGTTSVESPAPKVESVKAPATPETKSGPAPEEKTDQKIIEDAYYSGRRFIKESLKAPSTAKFSNIRNDDKTGAVKLNSGRYKGWGTVEAQNAFGVPLKEDWVTELQPEGDSWRIVYARLGDKVILDSRDTRKTEELKGAERFIGMSKSRIIQELGQPISTTTGGNPSDGKYTMYIYSNEKGKETFLIIWENVGVVESGMYLGTNFDK